jgi:putative membrane protein insertion efficiency factor
MSDGLARAVRNLLSLVLILPVRFYQAVIGPLLPRMCKFQPSCSEYFIESVRKHGPVRGAWRGVWRVCRCNPWNPGGFDPP